MCGPSRAPVRGLSAYSSEKEFINSFPDDLAGRIRGREMNEGADRGTGNAAYSSSSLEALPDQPPVERLKSRTRFHRCAVTISAVRLFWSYTIDHRVWYWATRSSNFIASVPSPSASSR